jgi:threonine aldolase
MAEAEVGDDVHRDDPTAIRLETMAAERLGKEAGLIVASGTMGNLVSVLTHAQRGDEIILGDQAHIFRAEAGGVSALGGISFRTIPNDHRGMLDPDDVEHGIHSAAANVHCANTALVALENTHNSCGGAALTPEDTKAIADVAHKHGLPLHIDGARLFNAAVHLNVPASELVKEADSVTFCLSKGLSCPVGSVICGSAEFIERARRWRTMVGGSMRQVGIVAAAGIVALENMIDRLAEDHANARRLAEGLSRIPGVSIDTEWNQTNLVFFDVTVGDPVELLRRMNERGLKGAKPHEMWRFVTHYGITAEDVDFALDVFATTLKEYT